MTSRSTADRALLRLLGRRGGLITAGEAASRTGCSLMEVENALLKLAIAGGADLRVGEDGTVAYRFAPHLRRRLLSRSWRLRLEVAAIWLGRRLLALIRIGFGLVLVALVTLISLLLLALALFQILGSKDGPGVVLELLWAGLELVARLLGVLFRDGWSGADGRRSRASKDEPQRNRPAATPRGGEKRFAFFEAVTSILFGDGDPNRNLERRRWVRIGCFLQHRGGAVIAEDLAPLLDLPPRPTDGQLATDIADSAMLAVLQRFDGRPVVNDQGELAFQFPSLQVPATGAPPSRPAGRRGGRPENGTEAGHGMRGSPGPVPDPSVAAIRQPDAPWQRTDQRPSPALRERIVRFSRASEEHRQMYATLCIALLILSPGLLAMAHPAPALVVGLSLFGLAYALLLVILPLTRLQLLHRRNRRIRARNARRRSWFCLAAPHHQKLQRKRGFARSLARRQHLEAIPLAYTTEAGLLEQEIDARGRD
ncbi:MAG: hypothetical protein ACKO0M_14315 [Cyanobium sp.]